MKNDHNSRFSDKMGNNGFMSFFGSTPGYLLMAALCMMCIALTVLEMRHTGTFNGFGLVLVLSACMFAIGFICARKQEPLKTELTDS